MLSIHGLAERSMADTAPANADFDFEAFLQLEGEGLDLGMMLGLPPEALGPMSADM